MHARLSLALALLAACGSGSATGATSSNGDAGHATGDGGDGSGSSAGMDASIDSGGGAGDGSGTSDGGAGDGAGSTGVDGSTASAVTLPPTNAALDYQLGGAYPPPSGVKIVSRDRTASPASGLYNICYVNSFQIQPGEESLWMSQHPELILRDGSQQPVVDMDWNEMLIDVSSESKRAAVADIVGGWIEGCKTSGFDAVEIDNLDSYSRSGGLLTENDAVATMKLFAAAAHARGLAIAQKNSSELVPRREELGTDFAVVEECNRYDECDAYTEGYGEHVLVIEYRSADFTKGCAAYPQLSIVLRDLDLVTPASGAYVYDGC